MSRYKITRSTRKLLSVASCLLFLLLLVTICTSASGIDRETDAKKWLKELKPCKDDIIKKETECNAESRTDEGFLLAGGRDNIIRVPLNGDAAKNVNMDGELYASDYDCVQKRFYYMGTGTKISSAKYDGTDRKSLNTKDVGDPRQLTVDWISRRLYWLDRQKRTVEVASLENPNVRTTVVTNISGKSIITVDPLNGKLYIADGHDDIVSYNLDGSDPEKFTSPVRITKMKVSMSTGELCYIRPFQFHSNVECINTRNKQVRQIYTNEGQKSLNNPLAQLAVDENMIYWTGESG
ncbi:AGAP008193-PA-like protein [Anopheles sinensis]|uniref:AGAP008193-PA-like protein n=1 Tax=Anopheles sinensis TaxID=74873 RepID=A0A084VEG3_ANOSI|nr:AGAP008193-PA-like protein [Anopheles sinensis]